MLVLVAIVGASMAAFVLKFAYWNGRSTDLGTMSPQWIAEYNASHPNP